MLLQPIVPFIEYELNKDFITEVLCINKEVKDLNCNGSCHLHEQLKKVNNDSESKESKNLVPVQVNEYLIPIERLVELYRKYNFSLNTELDLNAFFILKEYLGATPAPPPRLCL